MEKLTNEEFNIVNEGLNLFIDVQYLEFQSMKKAYENKRISASEYTEIANKLENFYTLRAIIKTKLE